MVYLTMYYLEQILSLDRKTFNRGGTKAVGGLKCATNFFFFKILTAKIVAAYVRTDYITSILVPQPKHVCS